MKTICIRYVVLLFSMLLLSLCWEFWLKDILNQNWTSESISESFSKRLEYAVTIFVFCFFALLYPYLYAMKEARKQNKPELGRDHLTDYIQASYPEIKTLQNMITICSSCKKIREDRDVWTPLEAYLHGRLDARLSHGLCPDCLEMQLSQIEPRLGGGKT